MIGTKLAHYEITSHLGSGGMGDVYQATDSKLGRSVAIKLLPEAFARDGERLARFEREARVLASLNHPNIAAIHGMEESGGRKFLVMELVPGETLADRIKRGPIPIDEAIGIAKQIAQALESAHDNGKGIIHRDLKPANVKLTPDGSVKVLDFGLAKAYEPESANANLSNSPTLTIAATNAGVILGTAAYMSPEQAKGRPVDQRTDIFAFGAVFYEMLTARAAFEGEDLPEILSRVLQREPDWALMPLNVPSRIRELLKLCLQKDAKKRRQTAADVRIDIEQAETEPAATPATPLTRGARLAWIVAAAMAVALASVAVVHFRATPAPALPETRLEVNTPPTADPVSLAISPDGRQIVFVATSEGQSLLWLRSMDSSSSRPLAGTGGAVQPFWSPDSRSLGFFAESKLKRIDINGGSVQTLADVGVSTSGAWSENDEILFNRTPATGLFRIPATGGKVEAVTRVETGQAGHHSPQFLPDGKHFLYFVNGSPEVAGIYLGQLDPPESRRLLNADSAAVYVSSKQFLFVRQGALFAQNFDPVRFAMSGNPFPVADQVPATEGAFAPLSSSAAGPIVFRTGLSASTGTRLVWFDRSGKEIETVVDQNAGVSPSLSPDGRHVAVHRTVNGNVDIWLVELERRVFSRFTSDSLNDIFPIWSPDGGRIVFSNQRNGITDLYQKAMTGTGTEELLLATPESKSRSDWSPDGRYLLYRSNDPKTKNDLWALPLFGDRKPFPVLQTNFEERDGQFSPDGKWIAYLSDESGRFEIYLQPFPGPGSKVQVSTAGGAQVRWRHDGKELFYVALSGQLTAVPIQLDQNGETAHIGEPTALFTARFQRAIDSTDGQQYVVSPDGQRFLMNTVKEEAPSPITVILNWNPKPK